MPFLRLLRRTALASPLLFSALTVSADFKDDIGYTALKAEYPDLPTGTNLGMFMGDFTSANTNWNWAVQPGAELSGKTITYLPTGTVPTAFSPHATGVTTIVAGNATGLLPGIPAIWSLWAENISAGHLHTGEPVPPNTPQWDIEVHTWGWTDDVWSTDMIRRMDWHIDQHGVTVCLAMGNDRTRPPAYVFNSGYNVIVAGVTSGEHNTGPTSVEGAGRPKPEIVAPTQYTSGATPTVAGCAGILIAKAKADPQFSQARDPRVVKALLLSGATKEQIPTWSHSSTEPLDQHFGAGQVNIGNSYRTLLAGRQTGGNSWLPLSGWDKASSGSTRYFIQVPNSQSATLSVALVWHRTITPNSNWSVLTPTLADLNLRLSTTDTNFGVGALVAESRSSITNVEHLYETQLLPGRYVLEVSGPAGTTYGLAWRSVLAPHPQPVVTTQPTARTAAAGASAFFAVEASGNPAPSYRWQRLAAGGSTWTDLTDGTGYSGAQSSMLRVNGAAAAMSGDQFRCVLTNTAGSATSAAVALTVSSTPALVQRPTGLALETAGTLAVTDTVQNTLKRITTSGVVTTLAGVIGSAGSQDGTGTAALFNQPGAVTVDTAGNRYVADTANSTVRKITAAGGVTTLAGSPSARGSADGTGAAASFNSPEGLALDATGNLYVADTFNHTIRKITAAGVVTTVAGTAGSSGEADGTGAAARFNSPKALAADTAGNLYVADTFNHTVRKVATTGAVTTLAGSAGLSGTFDGTGANALFNQPAGITVDAAANVFVADTGNCTIRKITPAGVVTTVAGFAGIAGWANGTGAAALFNQPRGIVVTGAGVLYVADTGNGEIRRIAADGSVTSLVLTPGADPNPPHPPPPPPPPPPSPSGGGGALAPWFVGALALLGLARRLRLTGLAALLAGAPLAAATYEYAVPGDTANRSLRLNIPASVPVVRGLLIWGNGSNSDLRSMATDPEMVAFAESLGFAVLGTAMWDAFFPGTPSEYSAFDAGLAQLATASGHPELRTVPWLPIGHSNGGCMSYGLNTLQPARTIAIAANEGRGYNNTRPSVAALATPGLLLAGGGDTNIRRTNIRDLFDGNRPRGALWAWAEQEGLGHAYGDSFELILPFVAEVFARRYPADAAPQSGPVALLPVAESEGWLVEPTSHLAGLATIASYAEYPGDRTTAGWLPSRRLAFIFRAYASHGKPTETATLNSGTGPIAYGTSVTYTLGAPGVAWSAIEFYEGDTLLRRALPTEVTPLAVTHTATMAGYSVYHALITLADGTTRRTTPPRRVFVRAPVPQAPTVGPITGNATPAIGATATLSATVSGYPVSTCQWRRDNTVLADGGRFSGATSASLTIANVQAADAGLYTLTATNNLGSAAAAPIFLAPPGTGSRILAEPQARSTAAGQSATFTVSAGGNPTPTFRWQRLAAGTATWADLAEGGSYRGVGTATLTVSGTAAAMTGDQFRCVVANAAGNATSAAVALTVTGGTALLQRPTGIVVDSAGLLHVTDAARNVLRAITATGVVSTLAGTAGESGNQDGAGAAARFNLPGALAATTDGTLYLADTANATIRKITPTGTVTTLAGSPSVRGSADGVGAAASFNSPKGIAVDASGTVYVADTFNHTIRKITTTGVVTTLAGSAGGSGESDGVGTAARCNAPEGLAVDAAGVLYVSDTGNHTIRRITPDGTVTTLAGSPGIAGDFDGTGANALFNQPRGLALDAAGNLYVADTANATIRRITPAGAVSTLAGFAGIAGSTDGTGAAALFNQPQALAATGTGVLYVADTGNGTIRRITADGVVATLTLSAPATPTTPTTPTTPPPPTTPATPSSSGGGGGGALAPWLPVALALLGLARRKVGR